MLNKIHESKFESIAIEIYFSKKRHKKQTNMFFKNTVLFSNKFKNIKNIVFAKVIFLHTFHSQIKFYFRLFFFWYAEKNIKIWKCIFFCKFWTKHVSLLNVKIEHIFHKDPSIKKIYFSYFLLLQWWSKQT